MVLNTANRHDKQRLSLISLTALRMASRQVDSEREQSFGRQFVPVAKHQDIDTTLSASFKQLLTL